jgi:hypothetical protein
VQYKKKKRKKKIKSSDNQNTSLIKSNSILSTSALFKFGNTLEEALPLTDGDKQIFSFE